MNHVIFSWVILLGEQPIIFLDKTLSLEMNSPILSAYPPKSEYTDNLGCFHQDKRQGGNED